MLPSASTTANAVVPRPIRSGVPSAGGPPRSREAFFGSIRLKSVAACAGSRCGPRLTSHNAGSAIRGPWSRTRQDSIDVMQVVGVAGVRRAGPRLVVVENLQRFDERGPRRHRRRRRVDPVIAIVAGERPALDGAVLRQIVDRDEAAVLRHVIGDAPRDRPAVEGIGAVFGNRPERRGVVLVDEAIARLRHRAVRQVDARGRAVLLEEPPALGNRGRQRRVELVAVLGVVDGRRDEVTPRDSLARVVPVEQVEAGHDPGMFAADAPSPVLAVSSGLSRVARIGT